MRVNFFAPINLLGYGWHSLYTLQAFENRGHEICLMPPLGNVRFHTEAIDRWLGQRTKFSPRDPSVMIFHEDFLGNFCGEPRIGFPVFEMEIFTELQLAMLRSCDFLLTTTKWSRGILRNYGLNSQIVNEGFEPHVFPYQAPLTRDYKFTFLHVGKFEMRKGTLQTIRCFFQAMEKEDAELLLQIENPFVDDYSPIFNLLDQLGFISVSRGPHRRMGLTIRFVSNVPKHTDFGVQTYQKADCGIFPSRAEGWGLPILECLATGVPVIVGDWTGQSEYLDGYPAEYLIKNPDIVSAKDDVWFGADRGTWCIPKDEELVELIRYAFKNAKELRRSERWLEIVKRIRTFTWADAAMQLEVALNNILVEAK